MPVTVGIASPGAMGSALGGALLRGGARVVATLEGRSARTRRLAEAAGLELLPTLRAVLNEARVVLSVAPPDQAEPIARRIADEARGRPLVVDLNAIAPQTAVRLGEILGQAGLDLVDGSISGPPPSIRGTTTVYLSGQRAGEVATLPVDGVDLRDVGQTIGTASAVKMCTASLYKGTVGLLAQALLTAHEHGVVDHVLEDLRETFPDYVERAPAILQRAASKAERYVGEMREIAATQEGAGLPRELFDGYARAFQALADTTLAKASPEEIDPEASLDAVLEALRGTGR